MAFYLILPQYIFIASDFMFTKKYILKKWRRKIVPDSQHGNIKSVQKISSKLMDIWWSLLLYSLLAFLLLQQMLLLGRKLHYVHTQMRSCFLNGNSAINFST